MSAFLSDKKDIVSSLSDISIKFCFKSSIKISLENAVNNILATKFLSLKDCIDLIPEHAGILLCEAHQTKKGWKYKCCELRKAVGNNSSRKLTVDEKFKIMRLGVMRIWSLKDKIVKIKK